MSEGKLCRPRLSGSAIAAYAVISVHISPNMESRLGPILNRLRSIFAFPSIGHRSFELIAFFGSIAVSARQWWQIEATASRLFREELP